MCIAIIDNSYYYMFKVIIDNSYYYVWIAIINNSYYYYVLIAIINNSYFGKGQMGSALGYSIVIVSVNSS